MLSAYTDGELAPRQASRVSEHLASCQACRSEQGSLDRLVAALHALQQDDLPAGLHGAIMHSLDGLRPSVWQRLTSAVVILPPVRPLAFSTIATALVIVAVTSTPLQQGILRGHSRVRLTYHGPAQPIVAPHATTPSQKPTPIPVAPLRQPQPETVVSKLLPVAPTIVPASSEARPQRRETAPRLAQATAAAPTPARGVAQHRVGNGGGALRRAPSDSMSTFDPLAPVLEPTGSRTDPAMANVVVAEMPGMPQPETTMAASAPGGSEVTTASNANDDLAFLRQRLSQEQLQLPTVKFKPRPRPTRKTPLLHSDF
jgi:hypothetical protein